MDPITSIAFCTNSPEYLDELIPMRYRNTSKSTKPKCTIVLRDKFRIGSRFKSEVAISLDVLEKLSQIWHFVIPTLDGAPELIVSWEADDDILLGIQRIIGQIGHIRYYQLQAIDTTLCGELKTTMINHLQSPTKTTRIMKYLRKISHEHNSTGRGHIRFLWSPVERLKVAIKFLGCLIDWANTGIDGTYVEDERKFERVAVEENLEVLDRYLKWFQRKLAGEEEQQSPLPDSNILESKLEQPTMAERRTEAELRYARGQLIAGLLSGPPQAEKMEELSSRLAKLEKLEDPTVSQKSYDLLIEIKYLPEIPRDDEFYITKRVIQMLRRRGNGEKKCSISSRGQPSDGCSTKPSPGLNPQQQAKLSKSRTPETRVTGLIEERQSDTMTRPNPMSKLHCDPVFSHLPLPIIIDSSDESGDDTPASSKSSGTPFTTSSRALLSKAKKRTRRESTVSDSDIGSFDTFQERISPSTAAEIQAKRRKLTRPNTRRKPPIQGYLEHENIWINESRIFASKLFEQTERELEAAKMKKTRLAEERDRLTAEYNRMIRECESECDLIVTRRDNLNNFKGLLLGWGAQDEEVGAKLV